MHPDPVMVALTTSTRPAPCDAGSGSSGGGGEGLPGPGPALDPQPDERDYAKASLLDNGNAVAVLPDRASRPSASEPLADAGSDTG